MIIGVIKLNIRENEAKRRHEVYEYVTTTHMICFFIMIFSLVLSGDLFVMNQFEMISIRWLLFFLISIVGFAGIISYNTQRKKGLSNKKYTITDILYFSFPLLVAGFTLYNINDSIYYPQAILLIPVIIVASIKGKKSGLIMATFCIAMLFLYNVFDDRNHSVYTILESNLILMFVIYVVGWFIGIQADLEKQHRGNLTKLANTDMLSGLYNHRYFQEKLADLFENSLKGDYLSLIMIDIDYFKNYNDSYGHLAGDSIISDIGKILSQNVGAQGFAARYGGDEFVLVLTSCKSEEAKKKAQVITEQINKLSFPAQRYQQDERVSVSCGIATYPVHAGNIKDLIEYADNALYRAKNLKKNKIEVYFSVFDNLGVDKDEKELLGSIRTLVSVINARDSYTYGHSERVTDYSLEVSRVLGLSEKERRLLGYAAFLHDIGKIEINRHILNKTESLTAAEFEIVKKHPEWGASIVKQVNSLKPAAEIILHHHENYDGSGYPAGLKCEEIPLLARIIRIVDSYDAMTSDRPYRKGMNISSALAELESCKGSLFDPFITDKFIELVKREVKTQTG